jgi:hypothetical protein
VGVLVSFPYRFVAFIFTRSVRVTAYEISPEKVTLAPRQVSGARARVNGPGETTMASETEQDVRQYLESVDYPAGKEELVYVARINDAP